MCLGLESIKVIKKFVISPHCSKSQKVTPDNTMDKKYNSHKRNIISSTKSYANPTLAKSECNNSDDDVDNYRIKFC